MHQFSEARMKQMYVETLGMVHRSSATVRVLKLDFLVGCSKAKRLEK